MAKKKQRNMRGYNDSISILSSSPLIDLIPEQPPSTAVIPMGCQRPRFLGQSVFDNSGFFPVDPTGNAVILLRNLLSPTELEEYLSNATKVERTSSRSGYGQMKPRKELCYTRSGEPYVYSKIAHPTTKYPPHVSKIMPLLEKQVDRALSAALQPLRPWLTPSSAVDICYDSTFKQGGSIAAHRDDEENWGMVLIYSLGQTRYLRVKDSQTKEWYNVELSHNSLAVMYGETFQTRYTHQVDKLSPNEQVGTRLSLNIRYLE